MGYGLPQGGASTSSTLPPPGSMYPGYGMPPPFSQPPAYLNVAQPNHYFYPQPGVPAPPAYVFSPPLPSQPLQQQSPPHQEQVNAQQGFMATQPPDGQVATPPSPLGSSNYQIIMMNSDPPLTVDLNLQTRSR